jgi:hypothetical protein
MRSPQWKQLGLTIAVAFGLSLYLLIPSVGLAGQDKVDVCHMEGNGTYHLITIAEPAYPSHVAHGDAGVGEPVPGSPGFIFDEDCNLVEVVTCPCAGEQAGAVTWDDSFNAVSCLVQFGGNQIFLRSALPVEVADQLIINYCGPGGLSCAFCRVTDRTLNEFVDVIIFTDAEFSACDASIRAIAANDGVTCP